MLLTKTMGRKVIEGLPDMIGEVLMCNPEVVAMSRLSFVESYHTK
jgi:hypothetical protein